MVILVRVTLGLLLQRIPTVHLLFNICSVGDNSFIDMDIRRVENLTNYVDFL